MRGYCSMICLPFKTFVLILIGYSMSEAILSDQRATLGASFPSAISLLVDYTGVHDSHKHGVAFGLPCTVLVRLIYPLSSPWWPINCEGGT